MIWQTERYARGLIDAVVSVNRAFGFVGADDEIFSLMRYMTSAFEAGSAPLREHSFL